MRELKCRAWDKINKEFIYYESIAEVARNWQFGYDSMLTDYEWELYIGRKDKNGKEIYDGDIFDGGLLVRFGEGWFEGHYGYTGIILCDNADELSVDNELKTDKEHLANYEIIGNVWENPELLKELQ